MSMQRNEPILLGPILLLAGVGCGSDDPKQIPHVAIDADLGAIEEGDAGSEPADDAGVSEQGASEGEAGTEACFTGTPSRMEDFLNACSEVATTDKEPVIPLAKDGVVTKIPNAL